ncbi:MAG: winged helix-turn-helix domain-containing protein [Acidimicrobiia bacterium]|nr:winged helix-turn-helix domain-containing protein [Acidimicrobiia bacterium]
MSDESRPDYELMEQIPIDSAAGLKALAHVTRSSILDMLLDRAASITQLAIALHQPKGSVGHHVGVLERAGLIHVVRTRRVRALTEKFYGRTARWFIIAPLRDAGVDPGWTVSEALASADHTSDCPYTVTARYARISPARAKEFADELVALVDRFIATERDGDAVYAMIAGIFPTTRPFLPTRPAEEGR